MSDLVENILKEIENKNYGLAIELCDKLISHQPTNENIYEIKAGCFTALKDYKKAADSYGNAVDIAVINKIPAADISRLHYKKGKSHLKLSEIEHAAREFKSALDYNPDSDKANNDYAATLRRLGMCDEALEFVNKAIALNPNSHEYYNNRGNIHFCLGKTDESVMDYSKSIELKPDYPNAYFNRGSVYFESLNDREKAKSDWLRAIELNPDYKNELLQHSEAVSDLISETTVGEENAEPEAAPVSDISTEIIAAPESNDAPDVITRPESSDKPVSDATTEEADKITEKEVTEDIGNLADKITIVPLGVETNTEEINTGIVPHEDSPESTPGQTADDTQESAPQDESGESAPEEKKTLDSVFEKSDLAKVTDLFPVSEETAGVNEESNITFSDYSDIFDKDASKDLAAGKLDDFAIPEFDFKSIFRENTEDEIKSETEESKTDAPVINDELKELHDDIQKLPDDKGGLSGIIPNIEPFGKVHETIPETVQAEPEKKRTWYSHPVFWILIVIAVVLGGLIAGYNYLLNNGNLLQQQITQLDSAVKSNLPAGDSAAPKTETTEQTSDTVKSGQNTGTKDVQTQEPKTSETKPEGSKFLGYLSDKQKFALFSEPEGYYVQIGSFRDKAAANEKFKFLKENNIKGAVFEADLKEKGVLYRVRAGAFESQEIAKEVMAKFE